MRQLVWISGLLLLASCSVNSDNLNVDAGGTGGNAATGSGGATASGGHTGSGGATATGGQTGAGGATATGGQTGAGGATATGGQTGAGGATATGGQTGAGGATATGGQTGAGGQAGSQTGTGGSATGGQGGGGSGAAGSGSGAAGSGSGSTGSGGSSGTGVGGGGAGGKGGESCTMLETDYETALTSAKQCTPGAADQCQHLVDRSLSCSGCQEYVNDTTMLDAIRAMWQSQSCTGTACPQITCVVPGPSSCVGNSTTTGGPNAGATPAGTCAQSTGVTPAR